MQTCINKDCKGYTVKKIIPRSQVKLNINKTDIVIINEKVWANVCVVCGLTYI